MKRSQAEAGNPLELSRRVRYVIGVLGPDEVGGATRSAAEVVGRWAEGAQQPTPPQTSVISELDFASVGAILPPDEAGHAGDGEGDLAVLGRIDEALVDEVLRISTKVCRTRNDFGESLP